MLGMGIFSAGDKWAEYKYFNLSVRE